MISNLSYKLPVDSTSGGGGGGITFSGGAIGDVMVRSGAATIGPISNTLGVIPIGNGTGSYFENVLFNFSVFTGNHGVGILAPTERLHVGNGNARFDGRLLTSKGANIPSAGDITLGMDGNFFSITGNVTINTINSTGWTVGSFFFLEFQSNPTVTYNGIGAGQPILNSSGLDFVPVPGSIALVVYLGPSFWLTPL